MTEADSPAPEADYQEKQQDNPKSPLPQGVAATVHEPDRFRMVNDFIHECNLVADGGLKVMRKHLSLAMGHARPRQFQYWQQRSDKATTEDDRNLRRILSMGPAAFMALLRKKGILPSRS